MTPAAYGERVLAQLDATRTAEKDRLILSLIEQLFAGGDPDNQVNSAAFLAAAINILAAFHPDNLQDSPRTKATDAGPEAAF
jgi:hypothetical protein